MAGVRATALSLLLLAAAVGGAVLAPGANAHPGTYPNGPGKNPCGTDNPHTAGGAPTATGPSEGAAGLMVVNPEVWVTPAYAGYEDNYNNVGIDVSKGQVEFTNINNIPYLLQASAGAQGLCVYWTRTETDPLTGGPIFVSAAPLNGCLLTNPGLPAVSQAPNVGVAGCGYTARSSASYAGAGSFTIRVYADASRRTLLKTVNNASGPAEGTALAAKGNYVEATTGANSVLVLGAPAS